MSNEKRANQTASLKHERHYASFGCRFIVGIDEAGRGPWAGPVAAGAVCLPIERSDLSKVLRGVRDSKQMTPPQRSALVQTIQQTALGWGIGSASAQEIDALGISPATRLAVQRALDDLQSRVDFAPDCLFLDYFLLPERRDIPQVSLIGGDRLSLSIAAASVLAKTWRDARMIELAQTYPEYGFERHFGYGTAEHQAALARCGPSPIHRRSFRPIAALGEEINEDEP